MDEDQTGQTCGNCGTLNAKDAVICVSCGVVLSAYAALASEAAGAAPPAADVTAVQTPAVAGTTAPQPETSRPSTGGDWRTLFDRPVDVNDPATSTAVPARPAEQDVEPALPSSAPAQTGTRHAPAPTKRSMSPSSNAESTATPPMPPVAQTRPATPRAAPAAPAAGRPEAGRRPTASAGRAPLPVGTDAQRNAMSQRLRVQNQQPTRLISIGLALFLGGCLFTLFLTAVTDSDAAIGFAFLCSMPIGFILLVAGIIMSMSRREGRRLSGPAPGTARSGRRASDRW